MGQKRERRSPEMGFTHELIYALCAHFSQDQQCQSVENDAVPAGLPWPTWPNWQAWAP